ncbi:hypothetical protein SAMN05216404_11082 [Nitrosospira multiformis]|uniref:Uncharacterized protein n=1 Tax=Nitrosospira multiformis TaxID=1231 RepID=A0A1H8LER4_9PROT|nr:hypothetical protein [Nitrosospira multiformis]SEO03692.1 hypothetical protein SAMN05216404_11082 [Nitrosospira multiformis]
MTRHLDHYDVYYADKLWNLLPAIYRSLDSDEFSGNGPLRELVNRIGAQAAILRRSIDRAWEDQSIETCDDWVIPYIGDLLATNLVSNLDSRAQRLDVAKTIYYRRRKGTLALLEELAFDVTGWDAKVVEFFRRMGRTRHGLDPQIGWVEKAGDGTDKLQQAEGLAGRLTRSQIGGTASLRNNYGSSKTGSAFDEFFHTPDFRPGRGKTGWHDIPHVGVFLWRLKSFDLPPTTPVAVTNPPTCAGWFTFDPTGRSISLFADASRKSEQYGNRWISPAEEQLPGPISQALYDANTKASPDAKAIELYPNSLTVLSTPVPQSDTDIVPANQVRVQSERGWFAYNSSPPQEVWVRYHYGFSSDIGAGPYDRRLRRKALPTPAPHMTFSGGGAALMPGSVPASAVPQTGTLTLVDSLTYTGADSIAATGVLTIRAGNRQRPLIRLPAGSGGTITEWTISGAPGSSLVLDGLFISGGDIVIRGSFTTITITCCTLDPGSASDMLDSSPPSGNFAISADGRELIPTRFWIEGSVETLTVERSIMGPIRTRGGGKIQTLDITDSILQALPESVSSPPQSPLSPPAEPNNVAIALDSGEVCLSRCTVLGGISVHRLRVSESILQGVAKVDDTQHGCVRFTAWTIGSILPEKYESVVISAQAILFTSTDFGNPGYCQLLATADTAILRGTNSAIQNTISEGSQDGSEMGAFARERNAIKERGLLIKFQEFMPIGLVPVIVHVT